MQPVTFVLEVRRAIAVWGWTMCLCMWDVNSCCFEMPPVTVMNFSVSFSRSSTDPEGSRQGLGSSHTFLEKSFWALVSPSEGTAQIRLLLTSRMLPLCVEPRPLLAQKPTCNKQCFPPSPRVQSSFAQLCPMPKPNRGVSSTSHQVVLFEGPQLILQIRPYQSYESDGSLSICFFLGPDFL